MSDNVKPVSFKKDDEDIKKYLEEKGYHKTFSYYVKGLIRKDMQKEKTKELPNRIEQAAPKKRNVNFDM